MFPIMSFGSLMAASGLEHQAYLEGVTGCPAIAPGRVMCCSRGDWSFRAGPEAPRF